MVKKEKTRQLLTSVQLMLVNQATARLTSWTRIMHPQNA